MNQEQLESMTRILETLNKFCEALSKRIIEEELSKNA